MLELQLFWKKRPTERSAFTNSSCTRSVATQTTAAPWPQSKSMAVQSCSRMRSRSPRLTSSKEFRTRRIYYNVLDGHRMHFNTSSCIKPPRCRCMMHLVRSTASSRKKFVIRTTLLTTLLNVATLRLRHMLLRSWITFSLTRFGRAIMQSLVSPVLGLPLAQRCTPLTTYQTACARRHVEVVLRRSRESPNREKLLSGCLALPIYSECA